MSDPDNPSPPPPADPRDPRLEAAVLSRALVRAAWKGALSTNSREGGYPYPSLVAVATEPDGSPLLLLSGLAEHTRNLQLDQRASLLIDATRAGPAALTGPRVTLVGRIEPATRPAARHRYLARHPDAAAFIGFADFALYALRIERAHLVAGFGRIVRLDGKDLTISTAAACDVVAAEESILTHMNEDHTDAIALLAAMALSPSGVSPADGAAAAAGSWRMIGCDPEGIDLASGSEALRIPFPQPADSPDAVRHNLARMTRQARATIGKS